MITQSGFDNPCFDVYHHVFLLHLLVMTAVFATITAMSTALETFLLQTIITLAKLKISSLNFKGPALNQGVSHLATSYFIDLLHCSPGHAHEFAAFLLGHAFPVHKTDSLIFIQIKNNRLIFRLACWRKFLHQWHMTNAPAFCWSSHNKLP